MYNYRILLAVTMLALGSSAVVVANESSLQLFSTQFTDGAALPATAARQDQNQSPQLSWRHLPANTRSLALIVEDPDAPKGIWTHWVVYNIDPALPEFDAGISATAAADAESSFVQGRNSWGEIGYAGPQPAAEASQSYVFRLFAVDRKLDLPPGVHRAQLLQRLQGHILAEARLVGTWP